MECKKGNTVHGQAEDEANVGKEEGQPVEGAQAEGILQGNVLCGELLLGMVFWDWLTD
jgi:hypothetical protein